MSQVVAVIAPGAMGSAVARRLVENGAQVPTLLDGRSAATRKRAEAAGMRPATDAEIAAAEVILSIVPPAEALPMAQRLAPALAAAPRKPVYVDCNAVDARTVQAIGAAVKPTGASFLDAGIIGGPPKPGADGPTFYLAGPHAVGVGALLRGLGLVVRVLDGPVGAASALKMSYAGITKGLTALAAMMALGAARAGAADALVEELAASQPQLLRRFAAGLPDMVPKAYRWVAEMREIKAFLDGDPAAQQVFEGVAQLYQRLADDADGSRAEVSELERFARACAAAAAPKDKAA